MNRRVKALRLGGVSALALLAGSVVSTSAFACTATATDENPALIITCEPGTPVGPFAASYSVSAEDFSYFGEGDDQLTIGTGASITATGTATPVVTFNVEDGPTYLVPLDSGDGTIQLLGGDDVVTMNDGTVGAAGAEVSFDLGSGDNTFNMLGGVIYGNIYLQEAEGNGADLFQMSGGSISSSVYGGEGVDTITVGPGTIGGAIYGNGGDDVVTINSGALIQGITNDNELTDAVGLGDGNDTFIMNGGTLGSPGADGIDVSGGDGNDRIELNGGTVYGDLLGNDGNDTIIVRGGSVGEEVRGNEGNDTIVISGGTIAQNVAGDDGTDSVTMTGGTVNGNIDAEEVTLRGGRLVGNVSGITGNTLVIEDNGTLVLSDGVSFTGTGAANGTVTNSDLAKNGTQSQVFTGFATLGAFGSTLGFSGSNIGIAQLNLSNGSTLFVNGNVNLSGLLNMAGSSLNMLNGSTSDLFTLGGLAINNSSILLDFNQQTLQADRIVAGTFASSGVNTIVVNLLGTPNFNTPTDIVLIQSGNGPVEGAFNVVTIPGTVGSLFGYQVLAGPGGGLILRAIPGNFGVAANAQAVLNNSTVENVIKALYGIIDDAIVSDLALGNGSRAVAISDSFGIFASGAFSETNHDGYKVSSGGPFSVQGADFTADDFSAALSLDFNAAKHFALDQKYGLNIGLFGGYASTDVTLGDYLGFSNVGDGLNKTSMFGAYTLFRQGTNYALLAASGFIGNTDVNNGILGTTGSYGTEGYAINGSVGRIFALSDRARFDLRGGLMGVTFTGDGYTDSGGNVFGKSHVSFGAIKFEPGIYADYKLSNGMVFSPYARGELQQRLGYENTATISGLKVNFKDADFSVAASAGFNLRMSERATLSSEIRAKVSEDSNTIGGKLGFKVGF